MEIELDPLIVGIEREGKMEKESWNWKRRKMEKEVGEETILFSLDDFTDTITCVYKEEPYNLIWKIQ